MSLGTGLKRFPTTLGPSVPCWQQGGLLPRVTPVTAAASIVDGRHIRRLATSATGSASPLPLPSPRWHGDLKARLGKCIMFGCSPSQVKRAAGVLRSLALEWRSLTAGSEGFLTGGRRGLEGQAVAWGEMDSFVSIDHLDFKGPDLWCICFFVCVCVWIWAGECLPRRRESGLSNILVSSCPSPCDAT